MAVCDMFYIPHTITFDVWQNGWCSWFIRIWTSIVWFLSNLKYWTTTYIYAEFTSKSYQSHCYGLQIWPIKSFENDAILGRLSWRETGFGFIISIIYYTEIKHLKKKNTGIFENRWSFLNQNLKFIIFYCCCYCHVNYWNYGTETGFSPRKTPLEN